MKDWTNVRKCKSRTCNHPLAFLKNFDVSYIIRISKTALGPLFPLKVDWLVTKPFVCIEVSNELLLQVEIESIDFEKEENPTKLTCTSAYDLMCSNFLADDVYNEWHDDPKKSATLVFEISFLQFLTWKKPWPQKIHPLLSHCT